MRREMNRVNFSQQQKVKDCWYANMLSQIMISCTLSHANKMRNARVLLHVNHDHVSDTGSTAFQYLLKKSIQFVS